LGDTKKAIEDYTSAINLKPNFAYAYNNRGNAYLDLGDAKKAIADYNRAIAIDPKYALAYKNRGDAYLKLGEKAAAKKDFQTAAKLYQQQGKTADSKDALKRSQDIE
jgi:tetratricopeptide (TPR) repeat protein